MASKFKFVSDDKIFNAQGSVNSLKQIDDAIYELERLREKHLKKILAKTSAPKVNVNYDASVSYGDIVHFGEMTGKGQKVATRLWTCLCSEPDPQYQSLTRRMTGPVPLGRFARHSAAELREAYSIGPAIYEFLRLFLLSKGTDIGAAKNWIPSDKRQEKETPT